MKCTMIGWRNTRTTHPSYRACAQPLKTHPLAIPSPKMHTQNTKHVPNAYQLVTKTVTVAFVGYHGY